jgi:hypothetical protein
MQLPRFSKILLMILAAAISPMVASRLLSNLSNLELICNCGSSFGHLSEYAYQLNDNNSSRLSRARQALITMDWRQIDPYRWDVPNAATRLGPVQRDILALAYLNRGDSEAAAKLNPTSIAASYKLWKLTGQELWKTRLAGFRMDAIQSSNGSVQSEIDLAIRSLVQTEFYGRQQSQQLSDFLDRKQGGYIDITQHEWRFSQWAGPHDSEAIYVSSKLENQPKILLISALRWSSNANVVPFSELIRKVEIAAYSTKTLAIRYKTENISRGFALVALVSEQTAQIPNYRFLHVQLPNTAGEWREERFRVNGQTISLPTVFALRNWSDGSVWFEVLSFE